MSGTAAEISGRQSRCYAEPRSHKRHDMDFYIEPRWAVEALLAAEPFPSLAWDPACGSGTILKVLRDYGVKCRESDAAQRGQEIVHDFLGMAPYPGLGAVASIVTNPPYGTAQEFVEKALKIATAKVAVLVQAKFVYSQRRHRLFTEHPPARLYFLSTRPSMPPGDKLLAGTVEAKGGKTDYLWVVWDREHRGATQARWLLKDIPYDPAKNGRESYDLAIATMREQREAGAVTEDECAAAYERSRTDLLGVLSRRGAAPRGKPSNPARPTP